MSAYETILVEQDQGLLTITLNRPDKYNALTAQVAREMLAVLKQAGRDDGTRCLLLTGAGKGFCAGQDLDEAGMRTADFSLREHLQSGYHKVVARLVALEKPVIVAVNGACVGAGLGLALAGDIRYASEQAKFRAAFSGIGLAPDSGASYWLPRLMGPARAAEFLYTNELLEAETAAAQGLVNKVVPHEELLNVSRALGLRLAQSPTKALGLTKRALRRAWESTFQEQLDYEAQLQEIAGHTDDYREGVAAFREKRQPRFTGQ